MKQLLTFSKAEGNPVLLSVCQSYLVVGTDTAHIRVFDLSRRYDEKQTKIAKRMANKPYVAWTSFYLQILFLTFVQWRCVRRDAKAHCSAKNLTDQIANLGALRSVRCNATGSQVSILISQVKQQTSTLSFLKAVCVLWAICDFVCHSVPQVNGRPDHKVYFYDVEMDTVTHFDFFTGRPSSGISQAEESER